LSAASLVLVCCFACPCPLLRLSLSAASLVLVRFACPCPFRHVLVRFVMSLSASSCPCPLLRHVLVRCFVMSLSLSVSSCPCPLRNVLVRFVMSLSAASSCPLPSRHVRSLKMYSFISRDIFNILKSLNPF
jgi:hypothetical protein